MGKLDLLLVNPNNKKQMYRELGFSFSAIEPPLWTGLIAAFIREKGFSVRIIDAEAEGFTPEYTAERIVEFNPSLIGISTIGANPSASSTPKMTAASKLLNILKSNAHSLKTFLYGIHPSALPELTLKDEPVDFICRGECFYTVSQLLEALKSGEKIEDYKIKGLWYSKNGKIVSNGWAELVQNLDELPFAAWDILPMDKYRAHNWHCFGNIAQRQPYAVIYTSLGCPFNCTYCNIHALYSGRPAIRFRSPKKVVEEIDFLVKNYNVKNIKIMDELFILGESHVMEICDLIIQRRYDLNIWAYARVDTINEKILQKIKQAGINWLVIGIESGNKKIRDVIGKDRLEQELIIKAIEVIHSHGVNVLGNFMFGLPEDDLHTMQETLSLAKKLNCEYVNFYVTMAYPGSQLYDDALIRGIRLPESWSAYAQLSEDILPLSTKYLSSAEVLSFRDESFREYYTDPAYLKMIKDKFGPETVENIKQMLKNKINREILTSARQRGGL